MDGTWKTACFFAIFAFHFSQVLTTFFVLRSKKNGKHFHFFYFSAAFFNFFKFFFDFVNRFALFHRLKYIERLIAEVIGRSSFCSGQRTWQITLVYHQTSVVGETSSVFAIDN